MIEQAVCIMQSLFFLLNHLTASLKQYPLLPRNSLPDRLCLWFRREELAHANDTMIMMLMVM